VVAAVSRAGEYEALLSEQPLAPVITRPMPDVTHGGLSWWERHTVGGWLMFGAFGIGMLVACIIGFAVLLTVFVFLIALTIGGLIAMLIQPFRRRTNPDVGVH